MKRRPTYGVGIWLVAGSAFIALWSWEMWFGALTGTFKRLLVYLDRGRTGE
jgi:hypothetical protein